jgi:NAD(P)-dependent dehydrogenase (short-subunit alcohol dehydrogenase family)
MHSAVYSRGMSNYAFRLGTPEEVGRYVVPCCAASCAQLSVALLIAAYFWINRNAQVAAAVVFMLSPAASWITGQTLFVDGGESLCHPFRCSLVGL